MVTVSRTELARRTRQIIDEVQRGQTITVESYGEEQIVLLDAVDYHILMAAAEAATPSSISRWRNLSETIRSYLNGSINLGKAAEILGMSRFELMERLDRLGLPLRLGPESTADAIDEINVVRHSQGN
jgi:predicted HTH domain antitoxin